MPINTREAVYIPWPPSVGVVIGTFGSVPYIRLQLEARKRYWPDVPLLIHDDRSPDSEQIIKLCADYGAHYVSPPERLKDEIGDMSAVLSGLDWAQEQGLDMVVKLSRRFVIHHSWAKAFRLLVYNTRYPTYSGNCTEYRFGLRSESFAMHVKSWLGSSAVATMRECRDRRKPPGGSMENWYCEQALQIYLECAPAPLRSHNSRFRYFPRWEGVGQWPIFGYSRHTPVPGVLWHNSDYPEDYYRLACEFGLDDLTVDDFRWIYTYYPNDRTRFSRACDELRRCQTDHFTLDAAAESAGGVRVRETPEFALITKAKYNEERLTSRILEARVKNRLHRNPFDAIWGIRKAFSGFNPVVVSKTHFDTFNVGDIRNTTSISEALGEPRHENLARFVCLKAAEQPGLLLTIGVQPHGLIRHAALAYHGTLHVAGFMQDPGTAALLAATSDANNWQGMCSLYVPQRGQDWTPAGVDLPRVSLICMAAFDGVASTMRQLAHVIARDKPQMIFPVNRKSLPPSVSFDDLRSALTEVGYACVSLGHDGIFLPYDPVNDARTQAIYASLRLEPTLRDGAGLATAHE